ncbi:MAG TPA: hypothetical protein VGQ83_26755 [Polyangia bacterium]|jgi:hypothetical protein
MRQKLFALGLDADTHARIRDLAARAGVGPLRPTPTAIVRQALEIGLAAIGRALDTVDNAPNIRPTAPVQETAP